MGICINYSGSFKKQASLNLKDFIEEVKDIAIANNWKYKIYNETFNQSELGLTAFKLNEIYGISITPPDCETVNLTFLSNGKIASLSTLSLYAEEKTIEELEDPECFLYYNFAKTQYAGYEVHKKLCNFFKYIAPKYFNADFELDDETNYYEDNDEAKLIMEFDRSSAIISMFSSAFDVVKPQKGESIRDFLEKVGNIVSNNLKDKFEDDELSFEIRQVNLSGEDGEDDMDDMDDFFLDSDLTKLD